jgi:transposase-like protein
LQTVSGHLVRLALHAEEAAGTVQRAAFRSRGYPVVCSVVSPVGLSFRNLEELMMERNLTVDHVTIWRWVQRYAPELHRRCRPELRMTNRSWRVDETYSALSSVLLRRVEVPLALG